MMRAKIFKSQVAKYRSFTRSRTQLTKGISSSLQKHYSTNQDPASEKSSSHSKKSKSTPIPAPGDQVTDKVIQSTELNLHSTEINRVLFLDYLKSKGGIPTWNLDIDESKIDYDDMTLNLSDLFAEDLKDNSQTKPSNKQSNLHRKELEEYVNMDFGEIFKELRDDPKAQTPEALEDRKFFEKLARELDLLWVDHPDDSYKRVVFQQKQPRNLEAENLLFNELNAKNIDTMNHEEMLELLRLKVIRFIENLQPAPEGSEKNVDDPEDLDMEGY